MEKKKFSINNMAVKAKITMFSIVMLAFMIIIAVVGLFSASRINKARRDRYDTYAMAQYHLSKSYSDFCNIRVTLRNIVLVYYDDAQNLSAQEATIKENKLASIRMKLIINIRKFEVPLMHGWKHQRQKLILLRTENKKKQLITL